MAYTWSNEETFKFIALYREEDIIWNPENADHKDRKMINDAWDRIAATLDIPVVSLKKKKETLMTAFRLHVAKRQASARIGAGACVYTPTWVFYEPMQFLEYLYDCKAPSEDGYAYTDKDTPHKRKKRKEKRGRRSSDEKTREERDRERERESPYSALQPSDHVAVVEDDECDLYGRLLASKLRRYSDVERLEIMYEIDGMLLGRRSRARSPVMVTTKSVSPSASSSPDQSPI